MPRPSSRDDRQQLATFTAEIDRWSAWRDAQGRRGFAIPSSLASDAPEVRALDTLSVERREVVLLHDLEGWTHAEIAERMELPAGTVRSHLHFARRALRRLLAGLEPE